MKLLILVTLVAAAAAAVPQRVQYSNNPADVQLIRNDADNDGLGFWRFLFEQSDGQKQEAQGELKNPGAENEAIAVRGSYSWVAPDGITYTVTYIADENGFQPTIEQGPGGAVPGAVVASLLG